MTGQPTRRAALAGLAATLAAAAAGATAGAHTPYRQWVVYRRRHLLIGSHRGDGVTYVLAQELAATLGHELPEARARVARGPRAERIATLMVTGQMLLAVLAEGEARAMARAEAPFDNHRPTPLGVMGRLVGDYALYATPDLPEDHAALVADALAHAGMLSPPAPGPIAAHAGAADYWAGPGAPG